MIASNAGKDVRKGTLSPIIRGGAQITMVMEKDLAKSTKTQHPRIFAHTTDPNLRNVSYLTRKVSTRRFMGKGVSGQHETKQTRTRKRTGRSVHRGRTGRIMIYPSVEWWAAMKKIGQKPHFSFFSNLTEMCDKWGKAKHKVSILRSVFTWKPTSPAPPPSPAVYLFVWVQGTGRWDTRGWLVLASGEERKGWRTEEKSC